MATLYIGGYWRDRKEDADACANRIVQCLRGLTTCDPAFEEVFVVTRKPYRIPIDIQTIQPIVQKARNRADSPPHRIIEPLGFRPSFCSEPRGREEEWAFSSMCGAYPKTPGLWNNCVLKLPTKGEASQRLSRLDTVVGMMRTLISAWDPDWAVAQTHEFRQLFASGSKIPGKLLVGWMSYFAARMGRVPDGVPVHSRIEIPDRGTLLILTEDAVAPDRPDHVATAHAVSFALQEAGLIPEEACRVQ